MDELKNEITKITPASFEPTIDYVVTKIPRFTFEKFSQSPAILGTSMKSVGEAMSIGRNFKESFQKALNSLEIGLSGLDQIFNYDKKLIEKKLKINIPNRILLVAEAIRKKFSISKIHRLSGIDPWFIEQIKEIIDTEKIIKSKGIPKNFIEFNRVKSIGFSDKKLAQLTNTEEKIVRRKREALKVFPVFKKVDTCAAEFKSFTPYMYSTYQRNFSSNSECEANPSSRDKIIILGGGPNRIGQGIEFDYCCCQASFALKEAKYETIMVNCNPETVSTDFDTADKLYFEPVFCEHIFDIIQHENPIGVIVQLGGQTALKLAEKLNKYGIKIIGTSFNSLDLAEDRGSFSELLKKNKIPYPEFGVAQTADEALKLSDTLNFPILVRPSYVLGGQGMKIVINKEDLEAHVVDLLQKIPNNKLLLDHYLDGAIEAEADAISDGKDVQIIGIMEHIEPCGIHSGDSNATLPPFNLGDFVMQQIIDHTHKIALELNTIGLINIQFAVKDGKIYILEVNPRASRTIPFISKTTGIPLANLAAKLMIGRKLSSLSFHRKDLNYVAVKEAVLPFDRLPGSDTVLTPEMRSTGEVMGIADSFEGAFFKSQIAAGMQFPKSGTVFLSIRNEDKTKKMGEACKILEKIGYKIIATKGTKSFLDSEGVKSAPVKKVYEGRPNIADLLRDKKIDIVMNTTEGKQSLEDSKDIRYLALNNKIPYYTTARGIIATIHSLKENIGGNISVKAIQEYHSQLITG